MGHLHYCIVCDRYERYRCADLRAQARARRAWGGEGRPRRNSCSATRRRRSMAPGPRSGWHSASNALQPSEIPSSPVLIAPDAVAACDWCHVSDPAPTSGFCAGFWAGRTLISTDLEEEDEARTKTERRKHKRWQLPLRPQTLDGPSGSMTTSSFSSTCVPISARLIGSFGSAEDSWTAEAIHADAGACDNL